MPQLVLSVERPNYCRIDLHLIEFQAHHAMIVSTRGQHPDFLAVLGGTVLTQVNDPSGVIESTQLVLHPDLGWHHTERSLHTSSRICMATQWNGNPSFVHSAHSHVIFLPCQIDSSVRYRAFST